MRRELNMKTKLLTAVILLCATGALRASVIYNFTGILSGTVWDYGGNWHRSTDLCKRPRWRNVAYINLAPRQRGVKQRIGGAWRHRL